MKNITIRALNKNDLSCVANIHIKAFSDRALTELGREAVRRYYEWQLLGPHEAIALGIFQGEDLAGYCFGGVFRGALSGFLQKNKGFLVWQILTHPWLIAAPFFRERMHLALNGLRRSPPSVVLQAITNSKSFGILAIAIDPQFQGIGLGKHLMAEAEQIAINRGFSRLYLTVDINNIQAISFYEDLNWQRSAPGGVWHGSMVKDLDDFHE